MTKLELRHTVHHSAAAAAAAAAAKGQPEGAVNELEEEASSKVCCTALQNLVFLS